MKNVKLTIEYEGTNYSGWQNQENAITIQQVIEKAIPALLINSSLIFFFS